MDFVIFPSLANTSGRIIRKDFASFCAERLARFQHRGAKGGPLFSLAQYSVPKRCDANVAAMAGAILDFDKAKPETFELLQNELEGIEYAAYTTFSFSESLPKFRLVIPFLSPVSTGVWPEVYDELVSYLGDPDGLDKSSRDLSRCYYLPICRQAEEEKHWAIYQPGKAYEPGCAQKEIIGARAIERAAQQASESYSGRNDALKAQVSACLEKGISFEETIAEIIDYDNIHHTPPLFEDPAERGLPGCPAAAAARFVANIWYSHARNHGDLPRLRRDEVTVIESEDEELERAEKQVAKEDSELLFPLEVIESAPGLVGEIASWITSTAPKPQPALSLGAVLAALGVLKGHRVQTETGLRTNLYLLGLGPSGSGKEHPSRMIQLLFNEVGQELLVIGEPASDVGMIRSLQANRGRGLILWDEIGHALCAFTSKNAAPHDKKIINVLLKMFSKANSTFHGKEYGNCDGGRPRIDIQQPCLCLWGTTVPERFYQAMTSDFALDGFLPRWLVVNVDDGEEADCRVIEDAPEELRAAVEKLHYLPTNVRKRGNVDAALNIRPAIAPLSSAAALKLKEYKQYFREQMGRARKKERGLEAVWARGAEHVCKVALTASSGEEISATELDWAFSFVRTSLEISCRLFRKQVAESDLERKANRVLDVIRSNPGILHSELVRRTIFAIRERKQILDDLVAANRIYCVSIVKNSSELERRKASKSWFPGRVRKP